MRMYYFTIVRHGQTPSNVKNIVQSRTGGELTDLGVRMAQRLGKQMGGEVFTRVYSSDLHRCRQTTASIASQIKTPFPEVEYTELLRERDYGDWEFQAGQLVQDKMAEMGLVDHKRHLVEVPNGETYEHTKKRAAQFFSKICKVVDEASENQCENILAVSHGIFLMCFMDHLLNPTAYELRNVNDDEFNRCPPNTARTSFHISKLEPGNNKRVVTFTHCYDDSHLQNM